MAFADKINGNDLLDTYNLVIQTGTASLLEFPERKESVENDWREKNGIERDLEMVRFQEKKIKLHCAISTDDDTAFWAAYDAFFAEITKPGWQDLYIYDHNKTYQVSYQKTRGFQKMTKRLRDVDRVFVKFQITLIQKQS